MIDTTTLGFAVDIQANVGSLTFLRSSIFPQTPLPIEIDANSGTITADTYDTNVSVFANSGTLNFLDGNNVFSNTPDAVIDIGGSNSTSGSLDQIHGTINIVGESPISGSVDLVIDDRAGLGTPSELDH